MGLLRLYFLLQWVEVMIPSLAPALDPSEQKWDHLLSEPAQPFRCAPCLGYHEAMGLAKHHFPEVFARFKYPVTRQGE